MAKTTFKRLVELAEKEKPGDFTALLTKIMEERLLPEFQQINEETLINIFEEQDDDEEEDDDDDDDNKKKKDDCDKKTLDENDKEDDDEDDEDDEDDNEEDDEDDDDDEKYDDKFYEGVDMDKIDWDKVDWNKFDWNKLTEADEKLADKRNLKTAQAFIKDNKVYFRSNGQEWGGYNRSFIKRALSHYEKMGSNLTDTQKDTIAMYRKAWQKINSHLGFNTK